MASRRRIGSGGIGGRRRSPGRGRRGPPSPPARRVGRCGRRQRHGGQVTTATAAAAARDATRRAGQHVLHDQRSARHNRRHVFPEFCIYIAHHDVRALLHGPVASQEIRIGGVRRTRRRAVRLGHDRRRHGDAAEPDQIVAGRTGLRVREEKRVRRMRSGVVRSVPGPDTRPPVQVPEEIRRRPARRRVRMTTMGGRPGPVPGAVRHVRAEDAGSNGKENAPSVRRDQMGDGAAPQ